MRDLKLQLQGEIHREFNCTPKRARAFADQILALFDEYKNGKIIYEETVNGMRQIVRRPPVKDNSIADANKMAGDELNKHWPNPPKEGE